MAKGRKTGGKDFTKGKTKTGGAVAASPDIKAARQLTKQQFLDIMTEYLSMQRSTLERLAKDKTKPVLHVIIGNIALRAIDQGDEKALQFFMDRLVGPVPKESQDVNINVNLQSLPPGRVIELAQSAIKYLEEKKA